MAWSWVRRRASKGGTHVERDGATTGPSVIAAVWAVTMAVIMFLLDQPLPHSIMHLTYPALGSLAGDSGSNTGLLRSGISASRRK